jgi:hypothetical protein
MEQRVIMSNNEPNLDRRLMMFEKLKTQVQRASVRYIEILIEKTKKKISEKISANTQMDYYDYVEIE